MTTTNRARECAAHGLRVMVVEPGMTRGTEITTGKSSPASQRMVEEFFATRPSLTPEDHGETVVHMVSQPSNVTLAEVLILPTATYGPRPPKENA